jgi:hypothetical protein
MSRKKKSTGGYPQTSDISSIKIVTIAELGLHDFALEEQPLQLQRAGVSEVSLIFYVLQATSEVRGLKVRSSSSGLEIDA